jgi:hypothetical protein
MQSGPCFDTELYVTHPLGRQMHSMHGPRNLMRCALSIAVRIRLSLLSTGVGYGQGTAALHVMSYAALILLGD